MAAPVKPNNELEEVLKPFYERAIEAEERLARLESTLGSNKTDADNEELVKKLEEVKAEQRKATLENAKLQYRILHLVRALEEEETKQESFFGDSSEASLVAKLQYRIAHLVRALENVKLGQES